MSKRFSQLAVWVLPGEELGAYLVVRPLIHGLRIKIFQSKMRIVYESKEVLTRNALTFYHLETFEKSSYCGVLLEGPSGREERILSPLRDPPEDLAIVFQTSRLRGPLEAIQKVTHEISNGYEGAMKRVIGQIVGFLAAL